MVPCREHGPDDQMFRLGIRTAEGPKGAIGHVLRHVPVGQQREPGPGDASGVHRVDAAGGKPTLDALGDCAPGFPNRVRAEQEVATFDPAILGPIANIKPTELAA